MSEYARMQEAALRSLDGYRRIDAHAAVMTEDDKQRRKACPNKPLTKPPSYYLTDDEGSECKQISDVELLLSRDTFRWQTSGDIGVDLKEFKKQCEEIGE